ncbi:hypothetical protein ACFQ60_03880 [Streptomyces zhihengii]
MACAAPAPSRSHPCRPPGPCRSRDRHGGANAAQAYFFHQPGWSTINEIHQRASEALHELNARAERTPQAAVQAARITSLAASLIARHAAQIGSYLDTWNQSTTPGATAMRNLTRAAEEHAAQASGIDDSQKHDTPACCSPTPTNSTERSNEPRPHGRNHRPTPNSTTPTTLPWTVPSASAPCTTAASPRPPSSVPP